MKDEGSKSNLSGEAMQCDWSLRATIPQSELTTASHKVFITFSIFFMTKNFSFLKDDGSKSNLSGEAMQRDWRNFHKVCVLKY